MFGKKKIRHVKTAKILNCLKLTTHPLFGPRNVRLVRQKQYSIVHISQLTKNVRNIREQKHSTVHISQLTKNVRNIRQQKHSIFHISQLTKYVRNIREQQHSIAHISQLTKKCSQHKTATTFNCPHLTAH